VNIIAPRTLRKFWKKHAEAKTGLETWRKMIRKNRYANLNELKRDFAGVDYVSKDKLTIFDISGNKYRLITFIRYASQTVFIKHIFTHAKYDKWNKERSKKK
jgi:mRNA interferase HigB